MSTYGDILMEEAAMDTEEYYFTDDSYLYGVLDDEDDEEEYEYGGDTEPDLGDIVDMLITARGDNDYYDWED